MSIQNTNASDIAARKAGKAKTVKCADCPVIIPAFGGKVRCPECAFNHTRKCRKASDKAKRLRRRQAREAAAKGE